MGQSISPGPTFRRPYGSWRSPITSDLIVSKSIRLTEITLTDHGVYWIESRPEEGGRCVLVRCGPDGARADINPPLFNCRTRVHEYGGGAYLVDRDTVYFSNFADQRVYRLTPGAEPQAITPEGELRYADGVMDRDRRRIICVREEHTPQASEPVNTIVAVPLPSAPEPAVHALLAGADFYSNPRLSPDGRYLCWICWRHPNMPWDGTELWMAKIAKNGQLEAARAIAGGPDESICQPEWSPDGSLYFVSDRTGWWNLYRWDRGEVRPMVQMEAELGEPQWGFRQSTYAFVSPTRIIATYSRDGISHLASIDTGTGVLEEIRTPYTHLESIQADGIRAVFVAASPTELTAIVEINLASGERRALRRSSTIDPEPGFISIGKPVAFPTTGDVNAHGFFYPPTNAEFTGPPDETPPLLVMSHGGPTSATHNGLGLGVQYYTSRGIAVLDVNYGGSSGFGRAYRQRLDGQWGIVDVDDCVNGALYLARQGRVDRKRLAIRGGSAGGFTTLAALAFRNVFTAGASHYGVSDLEALARDTHKFESRYLDKLIGPYPERADVYRQRSPIHAVERLSCPVIFFQGLEDKIVPPNQAVLMVEALKKNGLPVAYVAFEGEQHGFRQAQNIKRTLDAELYFYSQVFGFELADPVEPVAIANLKK